MKRGTKYLFCLLSVLFLVFLAACGNQTTTNDSGDTQIGNTSGLPEPDPVPVEYTYTKETVDYTEKNEQYSFRMDMERTDTDKAHYFFEKKIADEQRKACIDATEQILAQLGELPDVPEICVLTEKSYGSLFVVDNRVFLSEQDWQTHEYITNVLMAVYGDFTHYGLVYGYASLLCRRLNWDAPVDGGFVEPSVIEVCDLGLLCFDTAFVSEEDANTAKSLACHFSASCDEEDLKRLIAGSDTTKGMEAVSSALAEYYAENCLEYLPSTVRYGFGGISYDYVVDSDIGVFYLCDDWKDRFYEAYTLASENFLHENYPIIKSYFETSLKEMNLYRERFALYPYENDISIVYIDTPGLSASWYDHSGKRINNISAASLIHEYIHVLTYSADLQPWEIEGITRYAEVWSNAYGMTVENTDLTYILSLEDPRFEYIREYARSLDRPLDHQMDYLELFNIWVYINGITDPNANDGYRTGASFLGYLINQYGEQTVIHSIFGDGEPLPKSHEELVNDWLAYLDETYKEYSKLEQ